MENFPLCMGIVFRFKTDEKHTRTPSEKGVLDMAKNLYYIIFN